MRPGAPVVYGAFTSNVDMKSGAPAFGTPEYFKAALASGQLARHVGLPYRSSAPNASNAVDAQAMYETMMSLFGAVLGGCNVLLHAAGWLEGGLTASKEKFILDVEVLQMLAETFQPLVVDDDEIGLDNIAQTSPGGHFFGGEHTLARYRNAFYEPLVSDWANYGQWVEEGSRDATQRANETWKRIAGGVRAAADGRRHRGRAGGVRRPAHRRGRRAAGVVATWRRPAGSGSDPARRADPAGRADRALCRRSACATSGGHGCSPGAGSPGISSSSCSRSPPASWPARSP